MTENPLTVELWLRELGARPEDPSQSIRERLRALQEAGLIEEVSVEVWGRSITADDAGMNGSLVHERLTAFRAWADRNGYDLAPAFRRCERSSLVADGAVPVVRLPVVCLAVYADDDLRAVAPCTTSEGPHSVSDALDRLERGTLFETARP